MEKVTFMTQRLFDCLLRVIISLVSGHIFFAEGSEKEYRFFIFSFYLLCFIFSLFYSHNIQINPLPSNWIDLEHC
jgi:hypothetical protein